MLDCKDCEIPDMAITKKAVEEFGKSQVNICMEECAELIQALSKWYRGTPNEDNISEEIADVEIMLDQMKYFFNNHQDVENWKDYKLYRLEGIINGEINGEI